MGRPPIGKVAMTAAERVQRYRIKHAVGKPVTKRNEIDDSAKDRAIAGLKACNDAKDREIADLKARIAELETAAKVATTDLKHHRGESRRVSEGEDTKLRKIIRRLDSPENEHEAVSALRALA